MAALREVIVKNQKRFYEFFAGGGMARAGLGSGWECLFANDFDATKAASYVANWGTTCMKVGDVAALRTEDLPGRADLAWASFPCQDLSLAGAGAGLRGERSGTFWPYWRLMKALLQEGRAPALIVLENVCGALTSHEGKDFAAIGAALTGAGYRFGALVIDAVHFVPQSRPRLFIVAVSNTRAIPLHLTTTLPDDHWHSPSLVAAYGNLSQRSKDAWVWWKLPPPSARKSAFVDLIEDEPKNVEWHSPEETKALLAMMTVRNRNKVEQAKLAKRRMVGCIYKRTRRDRKGERVVRAEIRFDDVAGCLRTPTGGSSRQSLMIVNGNKVQSRLLSPREAARLMGLPEKYKLPNNYYDAYHLAGDGVVVPVVRYLAVNLLEALVAIPEEAKQAA